MQRSRSFSAPTQKVGDLSPDAAIAACLVIQSAFKHPEDDIVVARNKTLYLGRLAFSQASATCAPKVARVARQSVKHRVHRCVECLINVEDELPEIGQCRPRNTGPADK